MRLIDDGFISLYSIYKVGRGKTVNIAVFDGVCTGNFSFNDMGANAKNERIVKTLLWAKGGYKIFTDSAALAKYLSLRYCPGGARSFDYGFMTDLYEQPLTIEYAETVPQIHGRFTQAGGQTAGKKIGIDIGGSELKICAVDNGVTIFSKRTPWLPKQNTNPEYHYNCLLSAATEAALAFLPADMQSLSNAKQAMSLVQGIGISSAGIIIDNEIKIASIFISVPKENYPSARILLKRLAQNFPAASLMVANDGDVAALAGSLEFNQSDLLGVSLGTSTAGGMLKGGCINGWLNELAFVPVDARGAATGDYDGMGQDEWSGREKLEWSTMGLDEWSGDYGCGVNYLSQDGVIRMAQKVGFVFEDSLTPSQKMRAFAANATTQQKEDVYFTVGVYLGEALMLWQKIYGFNSALITGGVAAAGGEILISAAKSVVAISGGSINILSPKKQNLGQAEAASTLSSSI